METRSRLQCERELISSFPGILLALGRESVEEEKKNRGTAVPIFVIYPSPAAARDEISRNPFLRSRTLETSQLPTSGRSSHLTLIQLKTLDDRAKQRRIDHENFN